MVESKPASIGQRVVKAMFVVFFFYLWWKLGGLLLNVVIASVWGPGKVTDAYLMVFQYILFLLVYSTVWNVFRPAFMPIFIEEMEKHGEESAWRFASSLGNILLLGVILVVILAEVFAPEVSRITAAGFKGKPHEELTVKLLKIMLPGVLGLVLGVFVYGLLNSYKVFSYPAAGDAMQKLVWAVVIFLLFKVLKLGGEAIAIGFLSGVAVQIVVVLVGLRSKLRLYAFRDSMPSFALLLREAALFLPFFAAFLLLLYIAKGLGENYELVVMLGAMIIGCLYSVVLWLRARDSVSLMGRFVALAAPLLLGNLFARGRDLTQALFQTYTKTGVFSDLEFARKVGNLPTVLIAYALSVAMFPYLCELASKKDLESFGDLITRTIKMIALIFMPMTVVTMALQVPIFQMVFDRGNWPSFHIEYGGLALGIFICALFFMALENILTQSFFSMQRVWWPTIVGMVTAVLQTAFLVVCIRALGLNYPWEIFAIVALAFPLFRIIKNIFLVAVLRVYLPILPVRDTLVFAGKLALVTLGVGLTTHFSYLWLKELPPLNLENYNEYKVIVDNFDLADHDGKVQYWFSDNADTLAIEPTQGETGSKGKYALRVEYRLSKRTFVKHVDFYRSVKHLKLDSVKGISLLARASVQNGSAEHDTELELVVYDDKGNAFRSRPVPVGENWERKTVKLSAFKPATERRDAGGPTPGGIRRLAIRDSSEPVLGKVLKKTLLIDEIAFMTKSGEGGSDDNTIVLDDFELLSDKWQAVEGTELLTSERENDNQKEQHSLQLQTRGVGAPSAKVDLQDYELGITKSFRLRAMSEAEGKLQVTLKDEDGQEFQEEMALENKGEWKRKEWSLPDHETLDASRLESMTISGVGVQALWVDDISFRRSVKSVVSVLTWFEVVKAVLLCVPSGVAFLTFVVLVLALRMAEAQIILGWLKEKIKSKLGKGGHKGTSNGGGDTSQDEGLEAPAVE